MAPTEHIAPERGRPGAAELLKAAVARGDRALDEAGAKALLLAAGIAVPRGIRLTSHEVAAATLSGLRPPFAVKALSTAPLHKSDLGAVELNLTEAQEVSAAVRRIAGRLESAGETASGYLVEEMASPAPRSSSAA